MFHSIDYTVVISITKKHMTDLASLLLWAGTSEITPALSHWSLLIFFLSYKKGPQYPLSPIWSQCHRCPVTTCLSTTNPSPVVIFFELWAFMSSPYAITQNAANAVAVITWKQDDIENESNVMLQIRPRSQGTVTHSASKIMVLSGLIIFIEIFFYTFNVFNVSCSK